MGWQSKGNVSIVYGLGISNDILRYYSGKPKCEIGYEYAQFYAAWIVATKN